MNPGHVHILAIGHRLGDVGLGDDADRLAGPQGVKDQQRRGTGVLHQVCGRRDVVAAGHRRYRRPHHVRGRGLDVCQA